MGFSFRIIAKDEQTRARAGIIRTNHGDILTPAFVPVGTQASVKSLDTRDLGEIGTQVFFVNTYHLYLRPGLEVLREYGGVHNFSGWKKPLMSDSGGFQVFSLGKKDSRRKKLLINGEQEVNLVKIEEEGVVFKSHLDGSIHLFTPEKSIEFQKILGTDIMIAFDECTFYPASFEYAKSALERTNRWAIRSLEAKNKIGRTGAGQALYGVIQGGIYKELRQKSATFIRDLPFEGVAIGGVSVGESKNEMKEVLEWVYPFLPESKPRHLLGVGEIDDIFVLVEAGVDSFDCVMPTRLGRMGHLLIDTLKNKGKRWEVIDVTKSVFAKDKSPVSPKCCCFTCQNYSRGYLHHLFRTRELLGYRLATIHNLFFIEELVRQIRDSIIKGNFLELRKEWLGEKKK